MKVVQLFEMPDFIDKEMPSFFNEAFYSKDTLEREFNLIGAFESLSSQILVYFSKTAEFGIAGVNAVREDGKNGVKVVLHVDFKRHIDASWERDFDFAGHVLQIDGVEASRNSKFKGIGFGVYTTFVKRGYVIISDNTQYVGGKMLWKKIAAMAKAHNMFVYVINNGNLKRNSDGAPLIYDGSNIDDAELWNVPQKTPADSKKHVLFALTAKEVK